MFLQLLQTLTIVEESPADEVKATSELTAELLRTLYVGNLLEELVGISLEVFYLEVSQSCTAANFINPINGLSLVIVQLIPALCGT